MKPETSAELSRLSIHGLQQFGRMRIGSKVMTVVWTISLVMAVTLLGFQLNRAAGFYFSYPTEVNLQINQERNLKFPSVTFCSLGLVNKEIVMKIPIFQQLAEAMNQVVSSSTRKKRQVEQHQNHSTLVDPVLSELLPTLGEVEDLKNKTQQLIQSTANSFTSDFETIQLSTFTRDNESPYEELFIFDPNNISNITPYVEMHPKTPDPIPNSISSLVVYSSFNYIKRRTKRSAVWYSCFFVCPNPTFTYSFPTANDCNWSCNPTIGCLSLTWYTVTLQCLHHSTDCCQDPSRIALTTGDPSPFVSSVIAICDGITDPTGYFVYGGPYIMWRVYIFQCNSGYLSPSTYSTFGTNDSYTCSPSGNWDRSIASCLLYCPQVFPTTTGVMSGSAPYLTGVTVSFTCISSPQYLTYNLLTLATYTCVGSVWNPTFQPCIRTCSNSYFDSTGTIPASPYLGGNSYTFTCNSQSLTLSKSSTTVYSCLTTGSWDNAFQTCYRTCNSSYFDSSGTIPASPYLGGNSFNFTCSTQFLTLNKVWTETYTCQTTGSWDKLFQTCYMECIPVVRPQVVMDVTNSENLINNFMPSGSFSTLSCPIHFTMIMPMGTNVANCCNGSWDMSPSGYPYCLADCLALDPSTFYPRLQISYNNSSGISYVPSGTVGSFSCNDSYFIYGQNQSTTCVNGTWDLEGPDYPICLEQQVVYFSKDQIIKMANEDNSKDNLPLASVMTDILSYVWSNLSDTMRDSMGFSLKDTILGCTYEGHPCDTDTEIHTTQDLSSGNCFTFNHDYMETLQVKDVGENYGLHLIFDSQQQKFISAIATAGLKLIIHQQFEPFFSDSMGIMVSPGYLYTIGMQKESEERLKTPLSNCFTSPNEPNFYYYNNKSYLTEGCIRSEEQHGIVQSCNCGSPSLPILNGSLCGLDERSCVKNNSLTGNQLLTNCPQPCIGIRHHVVITTTVNVARDPAFGEFNKTDYYIKNNIVAVKVYYLTLDQKNFVESLSYTLLNLVSDIGSSLGLLMGMSLVSVIEVVTLPLKLIWNKLSA